MRSRRASTHRTALRLPLPLAALLGLLAVLTAAQLRAQAAAPQTRQDESPYTLHVYTNLVQIPTLVLDSRRDPLPFISKDEFNITLDAGPRFHPTHMRLEGDDPIDLAILLDVSGNAYDLQPALSRSISAFVTQSLQPHDHVTIYAIDCTFIRAANAVPASNGAEIAQDLDNAIHFPPLHGASRKGPGCGHSLQLWGALTTVAESIADAPGRRIILAISTGRDHYSIVKWNILKRYAASRSITIFGLYPAVKFEHKTIHVTLHTDSESILVTTYKDFRGHLSTEDPFNQLCQLTGGLVLYTSPDRLPLDLKQFAGLIRGRYILEFPRPDKGLPGQHIIEVTVAHRNDFIRPAGITIPLPDPALLSDPTTIPSAASPAAFGRRHDLDPPY